MPIYAYRCDRGYVSERYMATITRALSAIGCTTCHTQAQRIISAPHTPQFFSESNGANPVGTQNPLGVVSGGAV